MKNIDSAFQHIRSFSLLLIVVCGTISCFALYKGFSLVANMQKKIYVLANGKVLEAYASERKDNTAVEARDHVKVFHQLFFTLDPDDKQIKTTLTKALYLADASAKREYDALEETGYYSRLISGNINQTLLVDSVWIDINEYPYRFRCYGKQSIIRPATKTIRSLVTEGALRSISRSDNNSHGFLIERWKTIENQDLETVNR